MLRFAFKSCLPNRICTQPQVSSTVYTFVITGLAVQLGMVSSREAGHHVPPKVASCTPSPPPYTAFVQEMCGLNLITRKP